MAENQFPEYDTIGLVDGDKLLGKLQRELNKVQEDFQRGYTVDKSGQRHNFAQFSETYNTLADRRDELVARQTALAEVLTVRAKAWVPLANTGNSITVLNQSNKEREIANRILGTPTVAPAVVAAPATVKPVAGLVANPAVVSVGAGVTNTTTPATTTTTPATNLGRGTTTTPAVTPSTTTTVPATDGRTPTTTPAIATVITKTGVKGKGKGKGVTPIIDTAWEGLFKSQYPQYAWMFTDEMKGKYPDLFQLFQEASSDPEFDPNLFARRFDGSSWATELKTSQKGRQLTAAIGGFSWGSGNLGKFLTTAQQMSWEGDVLKSEAYKELFRKGTDGKYVNDLAVGEVKASTPYQQLKRIGTQFFAPMDDARIQESLTGGISSDDVLRLARERAKAMYPHLAAQIDAGLTLDDLAYDYKRMAAQTLELSPEQVDMSSAKFNVAMKSGEGGKERMMSTGEFEQLIRTDPQYGYHKTKQAGRDAVDIATTIARAFGKVG